MIEISGVHKAYGQFEVVKGVDLRVDKGEVLSIIGGSGSGKSTLLMCINGLEPIQRGSIRVDGIDVHARGTDLNRLRRKIGIVFQQWNAFPHLTVLENVMLAPDYMLFDEATSALDPQLVGEVLDTMRLLAEEGMTMVLVTHEIRFARDVSDRVAFFRNGLVHEIGTPDQVIGNPQRPETVEFLRSVL